MIERIYIPCRRDALREGQSNQKHGIVKLEGHAEGQLDWVFMRERMRVTEGREESVREGMGVTEGREEWVREGRRGGTGGEMRKVEG